ncbi:MAG: glycosyltransferase family 2 protein [Armatimonadota bacterium]|nr:glycosyltransferase family 2 protein [bacterium]
MTSNSVDVTVSIVNWNTKDELRDCLLSVFSQDRSITFEVFVADNASSDGSAEMIKSEFAGKVNLIENPKNLGFGAAHNMALGQARGRYMMILNPDCRMLEHDVLGKMIKYMDSTPSVGMLGPKVLNPDGSLQYSARRSPTMFAAIFRHTLLGKLFPNNSFVRDYLMADWQHDRERDVDWLSGSAIVVRKETIDQIGLLDERFFMYLEDVDWCRRAREAGWRVVYFPMAAVSHRIGAASDQNPIPMIKQHHKSMLRYFLKYNARNPKVLLTPIAMIALWIRACSLIRRAKH